MLDGSYRHYYENGQIEVDRNYINGELDGIYKSYYENGQIKLDCNGKNGEIEGVYKSYYESGNLKNQFNYKNGGDIKYTWDIVNIDNEKVTIKDVKGNPWNLYYVNNIRMVDKKGTINLNCNKLNTNTQTRSAGISFTIKDKKEQCAAIGFKPATDKFADCVLRLVELDLKKQISNPTIVTKNPGNQAIVNELKRSNNMKQSQFLMNLSNQLLNPSSPASSTSSSSCTVRGGTIKRVNCW